MNMPQRLTGRRDVVTATGQGIGRAIALRLADEGADVLALDLDADALAVLQHPCVTSRLADATSESDLRAAIGNLSDVRILVNCVGWVHQGTLLDCTPEAWKRSFALNVDSYYVATRLVLPGMIAAGCGSIINVASLAGLRAAPNRAAYAATKSAVVGLTRSVAVDFASKGVRRNAICPAMVETPSLTERINGMPDPAAAKALFVSRHPVGRLGQPSEIAALAAFLAGDECGFMTGATLQVDGGAAA
jgi:2-keto-3-deoxy-L-fuconate dehydrogenase